MQKELNKILDELNIKDFPFQLDDILVQKINATIIEEEDYSILGNSRIGGLPDLPKSWEYPTYPNNKFPRFIAQINFSEFQHNSKILPTEGIMYFFEGFTDNNQSVILFTSDNSNLETKELPKNKKKFYLFDYGDEDYDDEIDIYEAFKVEFKEYYQIKSLSIMEELEISYNDVSNAIEEQFIKSEFSDMGDAQILGIHPYNQDIGESYYLYQNGFDSLGGICRLFDENDFYDKQRNYHLQSSQDELDGKIKPDWDFDKEQRSLFLKKRIEQLDKFDKEREYHRKEVKKIIHLLSVCSVGTMMWSDAGTLSYFINIDDLNNMRFNNVIVDVWSS